MSLAAQYPKKSARFILLDSTPPGFPQREFLQRVIKAVPHEIIQANNSNLAEIMNGLAGDLKSRAGDETGRGAGNICVDSRPAKLQEAPAGG